MHIDLPWASGVCLYVSPCCAGFAPRLCTTYSWSASASTLQYARWGRRRGQPLRRLWPGGWHEATLPLRRAPACDDACRPLLVDALGVLVIQSCSLRVSHGEEFPAHVPLQVQAGKMDPNYQHPLIHIYLLKRRKQAAGEEGSATGPTAEAAAAAPEEPEAGQVQEDAARNSAAASGSAAQAQAAAAEVAEGGAAGGEGEEGGAEAVEGSCGGGGSSPESEVSARSQQQFKTRREGSMLARMLAEVKI